METDKKSPYYYINDRGHTVVVGGEDYRFDNLPVGQSAGFNEENPCNGESFTSGRAISRDDVLPPICYSEPVV